MKNILINLSLGLFTGLHTHHAYIASFPSMHEAMQLYSYTQLCSYVQSALSLNLQGILMSSCQIHADQLAQRSGNKIILNSMEQGNQFVRYNNLVSEILSCLQFYSQLLLQFNSADSQHCRRKKRCPCNRPNIRSKVASYTCLLYTSPSPRDQA